MLAHGIPYFQLRLEPPVERSLRLSNCPTLIGAEVLMDLDAQLNCNVVEERGIYELFAQSCSR
jgi:hypothetical protein